MGKQSAKSAYLNLSVEEENLAAIPFAVLERRVGKRIGKLEITGTQTLPDGSEMRVTWQVQGNNELGLPTEQDLDIFIALGVLTFQKNFSKTVSFSGRELAKILNIGSVHGKFYQRLKLAMDRFIPLRFRALTSTDHQEEVKWCNVFQEASFSLDRSTGVCIGSITWTDKLIQSMDSGFFRVLDAGRYMELDGITAKHLYRYLAVAFEKTDLILIDARKLSKEHLGIVNPPRYFSRLMQTLEPAFEQLIRAGVLGSFHIISPEEWRIALHRHPGYVPERKSLLESGALSAEATQAYVRMALQRAGFPGKASDTYCEDAKSPKERHALERACRLLERLKEQEVMPHVAMSLVRRAIELKPWEGEGQETLDWCEIALEICDQKRRSGQKMKNPAGLLIKIVKDPAARERLVPADLESSYKRRFREREENILRQEREDEERNYVLEYEHFCQDLAAQHFENLADTARQALRREKAEVLREDGRLERLSAEVREKEIDNLVLRDLAKREAPPFAKWMLRKRAEQAVLPFSDLEIEAEGIPEQGGR